jgi:hypothetical protein
VTRNVHWFASWDKKSEVFHFDTHQDP